MSTVFASKTIFSAVLVSFLLAQAVVWVGEIRALGIKKWLKEGVSKPYAKYFPLLSRTQRLRLIVLWVLFFAAYLVMKVTLS